MRIELNTNEHFKIYIKKNFLNLTLLISNNFIKTLKNKLKLKKVCKLKYNSILILLFLINVVTCISMLDVARYRDEQYFSIEIEEAIENNFK